MQPPVSELAPRNRIPFLIIAILSLAGVAVSGMSLQRHYAKSASEFCDFSQTFNCDVVNRSDYSEIAGIPVAGIGVAGYAALLLLSTARKSRKETPVQLAATATAGLVFALYLTWIEAYKLKTWCILCLGSLAAIFLITLCAIIAALRTSRV